MPGIYIHVPFCKKKCEYCDFYSFVPNQSTDRYVDCIAREIELRRNYLPDSLIETIYFGGGTPSMLSAASIYTILNAVSNHFKVSPNAEITLEANPDDLSENYLKEILNVGINRLSIGVQSFSNDDLIQLGRRHNSSQASNAVKSAAYSGFNNISIDLIYGLPYSTTEQWLEHLKIAFALPIKHLSCYHLIFEENTPLHSKLSAGKVKPVNEEISVSQFKLLQQVAQNNNFIHYEISNLAIDGFFSKHNTSYWNQTPYLGVGPAAHSYNGVSRCWNPKSINSWTKSIESRQIAAETEMLSLTDRINDYFLTSLRTIWGADIEFIRREFGNSFATNALATAQQYGALGKMTIDKNIVAIKPEHFLISDGIIVDFLV